MPPRPRKRTGLTPGPETPPAGNLVAPSSHASKSSSSMPRVSGAPRKARAASGGASKSQGIGGTLGFLALLGIFAVVLVVFGPEALRRVKMNTGGTYVPPPEDTITIIEESLPQVSSTPKPGIQKTTSAVRPVDVRPAPEREHVNKKVFDEATALLKEGERQIREGAFRESLVTFEKIRALQSGAAFEEKAKQQIEMARFFLKVERETPPAVETAEKGLYDFELQNGRTMRGVLVSETAEGLTVRKNNGISMTMPRSMIAAQHAITNETLKQDLLKEVQTRKQKMDNTPIAFYDLAVFCLSNQLRTQAAELLTKAWTQDANIEKNIVEHRAMMLLREALYFQGIGQPEDARRRFSRLESKFPETKTAAKAKEMLADAKTAGIDMNATSSVDVVAMVDEDVAEPVARTIVEDPAEEENSGVSALLAQAHERSGLSEERDSYSSRSSKHSRKNKGDHFDSFDEDTSVSLGDFKLTGTLAEQAEQAFTRASRLYAKGGMSNSIREGMTLVNEARELFGKSIQLYRQALAKEPGNATLQKKLAEAERKKYWSEKFQALNF